MECSDVLPALDAQHLLCQLNRQQQPCQATQPGMVSRWSVSCWLVLLQLCCRDDLQDYDPFDDGGFCRYVMGLGSCRLGCVAVGV
jgi:hypothetical protein